MILFSIFQKLFVHVILGDKLKWNKIKISEHIWIFKSKLTQIHIIFVFNITLHISTLHKLTYSLWMKTRHVLIRKGTFYLIYLLVWWQILVTIILRSFKCFCEWEELLSKLMCALWYTLICFMCYVQAVE